MGGQLHFISAGAGSGKTYRLTQILHEKLLANKIRPSGVIATTFTRRAATELRERVRAHLLEKGAYQASNAMGQARINTVNSICGDLLLRFAFEAGMSTEQQVLEENQEALLISQSIDDVMDGEEISKLLGIVRRMSIDDWRKELKDLINLARSNDIRPSQLQGFARQNAEDLLQYFPKSTSDNLTQLLIEVIKHELPEIEKIAEQGLKKNTNQYLVLVKDLLNKLIHDDAIWSDWAKVANSAPEKGLLSLSDRIACVAERYAEHPALHRDIREYLEMQFKICEKALTTYAQKKREMGVLDFTDQENLLLKTLDHPTVAETLREELDLLMVDEFQDTSPIQLALFLKLAQLAKEIYWVGDIKQAIYGFRGSDTVLMKAILEALTALGGDKEILSKSWRSRPALVNLVNEIFIPAFATTLSAEEISLTAERKEILSGAAFSNWQLNGSNIDQRHSSLVEGVTQLVASGYLVHDKPSNQTRTIRYGDIAILSRSNDGVASIAAALKAQGIPAAVAQAGLMRTPEAILAIACLRRLNDPSDTIATAEIVSLASCEEPEIWVADRLHLMARAPADSSSGFGNDWREVGESKHQLVADMAKMRGEMSILSPSEAMQAVIAQGQLSTVILQWCKNEADARTRLANLEILLKMAKDYEEASRNANQTASVSGLIIWFKDHSEAKLDLLALPAIDAVQVMTHHSAKGLEWPVVILMDLGKKVRDQLWSITAVSHSTVDIQQPLKDRFIRFWPWAFGKLEKVSIADTIANAPVAKNYKDAAIEESKRLLYVSMTRARDLLIFARGGKESDDSWIKTIDGDWLLGEAGASTLTLPNGEVITYEHLEFDQSAAVEEGALNIEPINWFRHTSSVTEPRMPLKFTPSSTLVQSAEIIENFSIGKRMSIKSGVDMAQLGTAIHACIGTSFTDKRSPMSTHEIEELFKRMGVQGSLKAEELSDQIVALKSWINKRWPDATPYAEIPTEIKMPNGQVLQGRIDLLLKVNDGWILIDHKSNPGGSDRWDQIAKENAGQLSAYKQAIEISTGCKVLESWLFLPISGNSIRVESN